MEMLRKLWPVLFLLSLSLACNLVNHLPFMQTPTPTITPSPTVTPTPTSTPTPTPTPTPLPAARVSQGDQAIFDGDWERAMQEYQFAMADNPDPEVQAAAQIGIGRVHLFSGELDQAASTFEAVIESNPDSPHLAEAHFLLGQTYTTLGQPDQAAEAYRRYLELGPGVIDSYVYEALGDVLFTSGDYSEAITQYQNAIQAPRLETDLNIDLKIAQAYALTGDTTTAIVGYQDIYNRTNNDYLKAQMDLLIGQAYTSQDQMDKAYAAYQDAVENFPLFGDSYQALLVLVNDGVPVDELDRGLVDYYAGQYGVALAAFDRYLQSDPEDPTVAMYYKALSLNGLGQHNAAIDEWEKVIKDYPDSAYWDRAWEMKAYTQWFYMDLYNQAANTLIKFIKEAPLHERAAEFLYDAGRIQERAGNLNRAAKTWERVGSEYPSSDQAYRALFLSGITHYRTGDYRAAQDRFQEAQPLAKGLGDRAAISFWSGKCLIALGDSEAAQAVWRETEAIDPTGYYSERAHDLLAGRTLFDPPQEYILSFDLDSERPDAEDWMRTVFDIPAETDLSSLGSLIDDPRFQRGTELWRLGLYDQARAEFEDLRSAVQSDPVDTYRLANYFISIDLYRSGVFAARQVLNLAGMDDAETISAPVYFNHLRFGPYYKELVIPLAQEYDFHPLFLFSVMRQESLFEGFVRSSAGARGLMQIIPSTGAEIAAHLDWPAGYTAEDLYRPVVSLRLGVEYLDRQRAFLGGDYYAALAAYNGGPGNSNVWKDLAPDDPDLFLEVIRFDETRLYIKRIYEVFSIYKNLYALEP